NVTIWDVPTATLLKTMRTLHGYVLGLAFSPDGRRIAAAREDLVVTIFNVDGSPEEVSMDGRVRGGPASGRKNS
ncbi:MAG: hypothetical protein WBI10_07215, partial [Syntrophales bacterium]